MRMYDIIHKKREGEELSQDEIFHLIDGYVKEKIPDYQMSVWAMAVYFQGMTARETADLTMAMAQSGDQIDLSSIPGIKVDKHSTGGVGDKTTLVLAPLVSAAGVPVAKMSGRGLGHTGGTIDKLESIPGFTTDLEMKEFIDNVNDIKVAVAGQTGNLTPADKKLYSLRDVTASVESIPLIASSIMSKKIAGGADKIILDVKTGRGAFMKELEQARKLARAMVDIGQEIEKDTRAIISDMNQPLGSAVGNSLEVIEAVETLKGKGPKDLVELCLSLGANMLIMADKVEQFQEGYKLLEKKLKSGAALKQFEKFIKQQNGNPDIIQDYSLLPQSDFQVKVKAQSSGFVTQLDALKIGLTAMKLGGGREKKGDNIDPAVGITLNKKIGSDVNENDLLTTLHINDKQLKTEAVELIQKAYRIKNHPSEIGDLIYEII